MNVPPTLKNAAKNLLIGDAHVQEFVTVGIAEDIREGRINTLLLKLMRDKHKAYLVVGHGEINDPDSIPAEAKGRRPEPQALSKYFANSQAWTPPGGALDKPNRTFYFHRR